jgi:ferredoxin
VEYVGLRDDTPRYLPREKRVVDNEPLFIRDYGLCILCGRCVRACRELRKIGTLGFIGRSYDVQIGTAYDRSFANTGCRFCGACVAVCPTGALLDKDLPAGPKEKVLVPCRSACPAGVNVPRFLHLLANKKYHEAKKVLYEVLPLPGTIGIICEHPCEEDCRRGKINDPIAIAKLHVLAVSQDEDDWKPENENENTGKRIAVIGSGLAGLSGAYFLKLKGHDVIVFEKENEMGGKIRTSGSSTELTKEYLSRELEDLISLGIEIQTSSKIEDPTKLLEQDYDAVLIAVGSSSQIGSFDNEKIFAAGDLISSSELNVPDLVLSGREAAENLDRSLGSDGEMIQSFLGPETPPSCIGRIEDFAYLDRKEDDAEYEAARCLHCNLRLTMSEVAFPPEEWLALISENVEKVPECEGVYILRDEEGNTIKIKGTMSLRNDITNELDSKAKFFKFEEDQMFSQRENELLQQYLQKHGEMPGGGDDELDDLF